ncbi:hypothetical protein D3C87_2148530 [compost metagenome]
MPPIGTLIVTAVMAGTGLLAGTLATANWALDDVERLARDKAVRVKPSDTPTLFLDEAERIERDLGL